MSNKYLIIPNQFYVQGSPRCEPFRDPYIFKVSGKLVLFLFPLSSVNSSLQFYHFLFQCPAAIQTYVYQTETSNLRFLLPLDKKTYTSLLVVKYIKRETYFRATEGALNIQTEFFGFLCNLVIYSTTTTKVHYSEKGVHRLYQTARGIHGANKSLWAGEPSRLIFQIQSYQHLTV